MVGREQINKENRKMYTWHKSWHRQKYRVWTPTQKVDIGKHAAEHSIASTVRAMGLKYPGLKQQTVSDFKLAYLKLEKKKKEAADSEVSEILKKKTGRPTLLAESLM